MSIGPIVIFDKSALQALNPDEACWFANFYSHNITPLFFVETLADLTKQVAEGRTPEEVVGNIAHKTPPSGNPNIHHRVLAINNLLGHRIEMRMVPIVGGGQTVMSGEQKGVIYENPQEMQALQRWENGDFLEVEYKFAGGWRQMLSNLDLGETKEWLKPLIDEGLKLCNLEEVKALVDQLIDDKKHGFSFLRAACNFLDIPLHYRPLVIARWKKNGQPSLKEFAPYAAHVAGIDLFFHLALKQGLISKERPSNRIDIAYLYYLPFCMIFVSNDRLHKKTAPLFLKRDQVFLPGDELKADLNRLDAHYSQLSEEIREQGVMRFAQNPPIEGDYLTAKLWDRFLNWRGTAEARETGSSRRSPKEDAALLTCLDRMTKDAKPLPNSESLSSDEADYIVLERRVPLHMGKWRMLPPEVENEAENK